MDIFGDLDISVSKRFIEGSVVFIIHDENDKIKGMVVTKEDYEKKIKTHQYTPLLFIVPFHVRIAYIYGCLNYDFDCPQTKKYKVMWRELNTDVWKIWFTINPHKDDIYY